MTEFANLNKHASHNNSCTAPSSLDLLPYSCVSALSSQQISVRYCSPLPCQSADPKLDTPEKGDDRVWGSDNQSQLKLDRFRMWRFWTEWEQILPALWTWSIRCWCPGDTVRRWESRCQPICCPSQSVSQHHWQTPANASNHSSSLSCPIRRVFVSSSTDRSLINRLLQFSKTGQNREYIIYI